MRRSLPACASATEHEAMFYSPLADRAVRCELETRRCVIHPGERGYCGVRVNREGRCVSAAYNHPAAIYVEPIETHHFFHVLPGARFLSVGTVGCNMWCQYCETSNLSQSPPDQLPETIVTPERLVVRARQEKCHGIAFSYNDPVVWYEYVLDTAKAAKKAGLKVVIHTAARIGRPAMEQWASVLDAINIDLKAFDSKVYREMCDGDMQATLDAAAATHHSPAFLEVSYLVVPGRNDSASQIEAMCRWIATKLGPEVPLHFLRFYPSHRMQDLEATPPETISSLCELARRSGLRYIYAGNLPESQWRTTHCPKCATAVVARGEDRAPSAQLKNGRCPRCRTSVPGLWK